MKKVNVGACVLEWAVMGSFCAFLGWVDAFELLTQLVGTVL